MNTSIQLNLKHLIQSSSVITRSNLSRYYIRHCDNSGRKWTDFKINTDIPYGVSVVRSWEQIDRVITAPHCMLNRGGNSMVWLSFRVRPLTAISFYVVWRARAHPRKTCPVMIAREDKQLVRRLVNSLLAQPETAGICLPLGCQGWRALCPKTG